MFPKVSVVMPVYNGAKYVKEAILSILNQSFQDFEFIIIDDRSTDNSVEVIQSIKDERIHLIINEKNLGRAGTDNAALAYVKGQYIAKMDCDDISLPFRFKRQVDFLDGHPEINVVGSWMQNFGESSYLNKYPQSPAMARCASLFGLPVGNPSIMLRTHLFTSEGMYYDTNLRQTEDFDFFARYADRLAVSTIQETLLKYRTFPNTTKKSVLDEREEVSHRVRENFLKAWGIPFTPQEAMVHNAIAHSNMALAKTNDLHTYQEWLSKLYAYNKTNSFFEEESFKALLAEKWFHLCYLNPGKGFHSYFAFQRSNLSSFYAMPIHLRFRFLLKGITNIL